MRLPAEPCTNAVLEEIEDVPVLCPKRLADGEHSFGEPAPIRAHRAVGALPPQHRLAERPLGQVMPRPWLCRVGGSLYRQSAGSEGAVMFEDAA